MLRRVEWYIGTDVSEVLRSETFAIRLGAKFRKTRVFINTCQILKCSSVGSSLEIKASLRVKFIEMNRLYTTYKLQLQIFNWSIKRNVSALFGHHQAYKEMVLIKVHCTLINKAETCRLIN